MPRNFSTFSTFMHQYSPGFFIPQATKWILYNKIQSKLIKWPNSLAKPMTFSSTVTSLCSQCRVLLCSVQELILSLATGTNAQIICFYPPLFLLYLSSLATWNSVQFCLLKPSWTDNKILSQFRLWNSMVQLGQYQTRSVSLFGGMVSNSFLFYLFTMHVY